MKLTCSEMIQFLRRQDSVLEGVDGDIGKMILRILFLWIL